MRAVTKEPLQIAANAVHARILGASRETEIDILNMLSFEVEQAPGSRGRGNGWDGRSSLFDMSKKCFPAGFVHMVGRVLEQRGHRVQYIVKPLPKPLGPEPGTFDPMGWGFTERYEYQPESIRRLLKYGRGIVRVATGGGKSRIAQLAYNAIQRPTLFLTTRVALMDQMKDGFENDSGVKCGIIGDGIFEPRRGMNVAMVQTLAARLRDPNPDDSPEKQEKQRQIQRRTLAFLSYVEFVIGEEAHEVGGNYLLIMNLCKNALYRMALTATPFMRADEEANMTLQGAFGSLIIEITEAELIAKGILAKPYFKTLPTPEVELLRRSTRWPSCYDMGIVNSKPRNEMILKEALRAKEYKLPTMVLIQRQNHGRELLAMFTKAGLNAVFLFGETDQTARKYALNSLRTGGIDVIIGSTIMDVGVDVPALGLVIIAGGGKAEIQYRQRIGRGLREKKTGPNICFFVDFDDRVNSTLLKHAITRQAILKATPGFAENMLSDTEDLPYHLLSK